MSTVMEQHARLIMLRKTSEAEVIAELKATLTFARDYFSLRGRTILATNIECQLNYFNAAETFDRIEEQAIVPSELAS
jgi:hypothetical protein